MFKFLVFLTVVVAASAVPSYGYGGLGYGYGSYGLGYGLPLTTSYHTPVVTKSVIAAPVVTKTVVSTPVVSSPWLYKSYSPVVSDYGLKGYGYGGYGYGGYGYGSYGLGYGLPYGYGSGYKHW